MKATKIIVNILLLGAAIAGGYLLVDSIMTPIRFGEERAKREVLVIERLKDIRTAQEEYMKLNNEYCENLDSLVYFLQNTPKLEVEKDGSLTTKQLEDKMTEKKAAKIYNDVKKRILADGAEMSLEELHELVWSDKEIVEAGLVGFARDTLVKNMIEELYHGRYTAETIKDIIYVPYTENEPYKMYARNDNRVYGAGLPEDGIVMPLFQAYATYDSYLGDLNKQEIVNLSDMQKKIGKGFAVSPTESDSVAGIKVGDLYVSNNNAGNWETL